MAKIDKLNRIRFVFLNSYFESKGFKKDEGKGVVNFLAEKMTQKQIDDLYEECCDGGKVSTYIFKLNSDSDKETYFKGKIDEKKMNNLMTSENPLAKNVSRIPTIRGIVFSDRYVKFYYYWKEAWKNFMSQVDNGRIGDCRFPAYSKGLCKVHFDFDIIGVRARDQIIANAIAKDFQDLFNIEIEDVSFRGKIEDWKRISVDTTHSSIKLLQRAIAKIKFSKNPKVGDKELLKDDEYKRLKKQGEEVSVNLKFEIPDPFNPKSTKLITFKINAEEGKIFFYNDVCEAEIESVLRQIPIIN